MFQGEVVGRDDVQLGTRDATTDTHVRWFSMGCRKVRRHCHHLTTLKYCSRWPRQSVSARINGFPKKRTQTDSILTE